MTDQIRLRAAGAYLLNLKTSVPVAKVHGRSEGYARPEEEERAIARRMAACWNACAHISTEMLEEHAGIVQVGINYRTVFDKALIYRTAVMESRRFGEAMAEGGVENCDHVRFSQVSNFQISAQRNLLKAVEQVAPLIPPAAATTNEPQS